MTRRFARMAIGTALLAAALPAPASAASFVARLKAPGHHPKAGKAWKIKVSARTKSGKGLRATAFYQYLFNGQVVATRYPSPHAPTTHVPYRFKGSYRDPIRWPKRSVGYDLTFRVVVEVNGRGTRNLDYGVSVRK